MVRALFTVLVVLAALPASAQQLTLKIEDGLVTMTASAVPVREVLAAWSRVGGTQVVNGERVSSQPLTLTLENVPEAKALDIILRGAAGYVAAARAVPGSGSSSYDRILILASSTPPAATAAAGGRSGAGGFNPPVVQEPEVVDTGDPVAEMPDAMQAPMDPSQNPFAAAFAQPGVNQQFGQPAPFGQPAQFGQPMPFGQPMQGAPFGQPGQVPFGQPGATPFGVPMTPNGNGLFVPVPQQPENDAVPSFFGVPGATTPGVVQPPAQPGQPVRPRSRN